MHTDKRACVNSVPIPNGLRTRLGFANQLSQQFKAHKSLEAYNQFANEWVREVESWSISDKIVVTGKVSTTWPPPHHLLL